MVLSHGHVRRLVDAGADFVFLPAVENSAEGLEPIRSTFRRRDSDSAYCYYSQYLPSVDREAHRHSPSQSASSRRCCRFVKEALRRQADSSMTLLRRRSPDLTREETQQAFTEANALFTAARTRLAGSFQRAGNDESGLRILLLGRPYVVFDESLSLSLPQTFEELGAAVFWQEELDLEGFALTYGASTWSACTGITASSS